MPGTLSTDLPLLAIAGILLTVSLLMPGRGWSALWRIPALAFLLIYAADAVITAQFATRLSLSDIFVYLQQPTIIAQQLGELAAWQLLVALAMAATLMAIAWPGRRYRLSWPIAGRFIVVWAVIAGTGWMIPAPDYVHDWAIRNVVAANLGNGTTTDYAKETRERLVDDSYPPLTCRAGEGKRENVVVLILESWSSYHSALWSGINNWTPNLDAIARDAIRFERFHAAGFNTNDGLTALLTGQPFSLPMTPPSQTEPFETARRPRTTLPRQLGAHGYRSHFITSGDLSFTRKGEWLERIGFDALEGHDHPAYDGVSRHHFNAVPDDVLYDRAQSAIKTLASESSPYLAVVESVSTHHPFRHPYTGARDEAAVVGFMDESAAGFIATLEQGDFFDNGILAVVSDHRAMTFISEAEARQFGRAAASRIPAFIMTGNGRGRTVDSLFHQADLLPTLVGRVTDSVCSTPWQRAMLANEARSPASSRCVLHTRGDQRDRIDAFCEKGSGTVQVDGANSRFMASEGLSESRRQAILTRIAATRLNASRGGQ